MISRVSITIPCFNPSADILRETLNSVRHSTFQNYTVHIVNDGSTEPTFLDVFVRTHAAVPRLQVIHHPENRGLSAARNTGFRAVQTEFVMPLDYDDLIAPTFLEKTQAALAAHPHAAFAYTWVKVFGAAHSMWQCPRWSLTTLLQQNICPPTALIRRSCWEAAGGYSEDLREGLEDWDLWLKFAERGWYGVLVPEPLFFYRRRHDSMLARLMATGRRWEIQQELIERHRGLYEEYLPEVVGGLARRAFVAETQPSRPERLARRIARRAARTAVESGIRLPLPRSRRILFHTERLGQGGLERALAMTAGALAAAGRTVRVGVNGVGGVTPDDTCVIGTSILRQAAFLLSERPAAIVGHDFSVFQLAAQGLGIRWVQMLQNCPAWIDPHWMAVIRRRLLAADGLWAVSARVRDYTERVLEIPAGRIRVIPNPVQVCSSSDPAEARLGVRAAWRIPSDAVLLLCLARQEATKGLGHLLTALPHLRPRYPALVVAFVGGKGDVGYSLRLQRLVERLGLREQVRWVDWQSDVNRWYAAADLFVLPSLLEGSSLAAAEALASGLPSVLTRVGDAEELAEMTGAVVLLDPPQGSYLDIQPPNYDWCLTAEFPEFHERLATAIETALDRLDALRTLARENAGRLAAARSPDAIAQIMLAELRSLGIE